MADIDGRALSWTFIIYPESMPENWLSILREKHIMGAVSPLHDKDIDENGEYKKPHYHVILKYPSKKSLQQVYSIQMKLGSHVPAEPVESFEGMLRYLIHADDPEKYQYSEDSITPLGGLDVHSYFLPPKHEVAQIVYDVIGFLFKHPDIDEFDVLAGYFQDNPRTLMILANYPCYGVVRILNSRRYRNSKKDKKEDKNE